MKPVSEKNNFLYLTVGIVVLLFVGAVSDQFEGVIGQGGLMLCRIPVETANERSEYYGSRTREQMVAVDQDLMKDQHPSMPISNSRQSRVSFGGSRRDSE